MSTNAYLLSPEISDDIISSGMDIIQISINGMSNEQYKDITGHDVDFDKIKNSVAYLHSIKGNAHIHVKCIGDLFNDEQKTHFLNTFSPICDTIHIDNLVNQWLDVKFDNVSGANRFDLQSAEHSLICSRPFYAMLVYPDGNVNCCVANINQPFSLGNAKTTSLYDIWNSKEYYELRMAFLLGDYQSKYRNCSMCSFTEFQSSEDLTPYRNELMEKYRRYHAEPEKNHT
jgi:radical SAM protein with 4Fe4S-binding SPASM domain